VKTALENGDFALTKVSQAYVIGWIVIASEVQQWTDITLLFGEISSLNIVPDTTIYYDYNIILQRVSI
jgi:hypothetical protein